MFNSNQNQVHSMAQLNCPTCTHHGAANQGQWVDPWMHPHHHHGSNLSLNMPPMSPHFPPPPHMHGTPQGWMGGAWMPHRMYPPPPMMPHTHSRPVSPTQSIKSRKSYATSKKSRGKYRREASTSSGSESEEERDDSIDERRSSMGESRRRHSKRSHQSVPRDLQRRNTIEGSSRASVARSVTSRKSKSKMRSPSLSSDPEMDLNDDSINDDNSKKQGWECNHCTYFNESDTKVCLVCCKTKDLPQDTEPGNIEVEVKEIQPKLNTSDFSETESVQNRLEKLQLRRQSLKEQEKLLLEEKKKGRSRKISFWPGTKFMSSKITN